MANRHDSNRKPPAPNAMLNPRPIEPIAQPQAEETATQRLDRLFHADLLPFTRGLSPVSLALAGADWAWHLGTQPGRQLELASLAARLAGDTVRIALGQLPDVPAGDADDDPRFRHAAWAAWPFNLLRTGFRQSEAFWREAASAPGMTPHHAAMTQFFARQWLGMMAPANWLPTNPVVLADVAESFGTHLAKGMMHLATDLAGIPDPEQVAQAQRFQVGRDLATTPGKVVWRNRLIELIRYAPQTAQVRPEPLLIVPSWIMKYYILDLSPHNSMVRWLVGQGHTVYMLSWRNPDASDRDLTMDDYLRLGVFDALRTIARLHGLDQRVHAMGYCLGGTLLAIAMAALASPTPIDCCAGELPPLASMTLLAAQTDFADPGELGLFIDEGQVGYLSEITRGQGFLTGKQMGGSFQFLHSRELVWTRQMREYLMGEREQRNDLMAWNADTTRMPARMHHQYLTALYLRNALANGAYRVEGRAVSLADIRAPVFLVATERDHVSPWRSVYKLHHLSDAEITFVLTAGGHNAGIVSEPGHPGRRCRIAVRPAQGTWVDPEAWLARAEPREGSWWPAWHEWLAARSSAPVRAQPIPKSAVLGDAPGEYVMQRYPD